MQLDIATISKKGGRKVNEDACNYLSLPNISCCVLSDGLGGHYGGEIASKLVIDGVLEAFKEVSECSGQAIKLLLQKGNNDIIQAQMNDTKLNQMRATAVILIVDKLKKIATWGHVGDSRLYYFQNNQIFIQTHDHSIAQSMIDAGYMRAEDLRSSPTRNQLYAALGDADDSKYDVAASGVSLKHGDAFLMCSDGWWEYIEETEMESTLNFANTAQDWLEKLEQLVLARGHDKQDNYSAIAVMCKD